MEPVRLPQLVRWIIWAALSGSILMYLVVLQVSDSSGEAGGDFSHLKNLFYLIGIGLVAASQAIKYFAGHVRESDGTPKTPAWIDQAFIGSLAFAETPAILGLVLGMSGSSMQDYLPLFVIAGIALLLVAPPFFYRKEKTSR